ncbi:MAG TPA: AI-2E family transporter [Steroidobacteraceae bacterium]|nr:AI-2E family transporter [Steroidobacteraceae bacterium]
MNGRAQGADTTRIALLTIVVVVAVLKLAQEVFVPLALAILLTFLLAPLVKMLRRWHINRGLAVILSMALAFSVIGAVGTGVFNQFADLAHELPDYQHQLRVNLTHLSGVLRIGVEKTTRAVDQLTREIDRVAPLEPRQRGVSKVQVVQPPENALQTVRDVVSPVVKPLATTLAVIVLVAFMLLRLPDLRERLLRLLGSRNMYITTEALNEAASRVSRYLLMQILINGWTGLWVAGGLWYLGVPNALLWGALTMVLRFIPYIGVWMSAAMPLTLSFAVFDDWMRPLEIFGLFAVLELLSYAVLEPLLYGSHTGVSPVALLLAAGFWTWLWGFAGLLLAIPMTVCAAVMGKYIPQLQFLWVLLGDEPVMEPYERLYQRLLSSSADDADRVLHGALRAKSLLEVCDSILVPAIALVEADHERGVLTDAKRSTIFEHVSLWLDERLDSLDSMRSRLVGFANPDRPPPILCIAAADRADEIVAKVFEAVLLERGMNPYVRSARDNFEPTLPPGTMAVVVSALPPEAVPSARAVCKSVHTSDPTMPVFVGLWCASGALERSRQRLEAAGAQGVVTTLAEAFTLLDGERGRVRHARLERAAASGGAGDAEVADSASETPAGQPVGGS